MHGRYQSADDVGGLMFVDFPLQRAQVDARAPKAYGHAVLLEVGLLPQVTGLASLLGGLTGCTASRAAVMLDEQTW